MATNKGKNVDLGRRAGAVIPAIVLAALAGTPAAWAQDDMIDPANHQASTDATMTQPQAGGQLVDEALVVDLHVNDEDLGNVLEMLSLQSKRNIIASKGVSARVTANLYGVTFYEALDSILHANGFDYIEKGNFIYIYTAEEIAQLEKAARRMVSRVVRLNYLNAVDAAEFVKPLLSEQGQIKTNGKSENFPSIGEVPVGADAFANTSTLVVVDFEDNINEVVAMIHELDTKPAQVLVEATILQTRLSEDNAWGVDFSLMGDADFAEFFSFGGPLRATDALIAGQVDGGPFPFDGEASSVTSSVGRTSSGKSGIKLGIVKDNVAAFLRILDEVSDTTVVSNPKILALNRMPARVLVGRKVGYISTTSTDTATTQSVQFLDTGTSLYFRPFVTNEGRIRMELRPSVSEAAIRDVSDASGSAVTIPDEITNQLTTNVIVGDGQTIVLGGLFRESTTNSRSQVPVLGDLPVVGAAFRGQDDNTERNEIIFLITPTIVSDEVIATDGARASEFVDRVRTGSRAGLLPWSRDRLTGAWNVEAERLASQGKTDEAKWKLRQSLWLNSHQPDARALRERITGEKESMAGRSMLEEIIRGEGVNRRKGAMAPSFPSQRELAAQATPNHSFRTNTSNTQNSMNWQTSSAQTSQVDQDAFQPEMQMVQSSNQDSAQDSNTTFNHDQIQQQAQGWDSFQDQNSQEWTSPGEPQYMAQVQPGNPSQSSGGFFSGLFLWLQANNSVSNSRDSAFTSVNEAPISGDE